MIDRIMWGRVSCQETRVIAVFVAPNGFSWEVAFPNMAVARDLILSTVGLAGARCPYLVRVRPKA